MIWQIIDGKEIALFRLRVVIVDHIAVLKENRLTKDRFFWCLVVFVKLISVFWKIAWNRHFLIDRWGLAYSKPKNEGVGDDSAIDRHIWNDYQSKWKNVIKAQYLCKRLFYERDIITKLVSFLTSFYFENHRENSTTNYGINFTVRFNSK